MFQSTDDLHYFLQIGHTAQGAGARSYNLGARSPNRGAGSEMQLNLSP